MREDYQAWLCLAGAILFELTGTVSMKMADGFSHFWPSALIFVCYGLAMALLTLALKGIELSVAYAIWGGLGTILVTLIGIRFFHESADLLKIASIALIVAGVVGLKLVDARNPA